MIFYSYSVFAISTDFSVCNGESVRFMGMLSKIMAMFTYNLTVDALNNLTVASDIRIGRVLMISAEIIAPDANSMFGKMTRGGKSYNVSSSPLT